MYRSRPMIGRGDIDGARLRTPRGELERLREVREHQRAEVASRIMEAMLEVCGERGYRRASVQNVLDRCGASRRQFYGHFRSKADCYADAYEIEIEHRYAALVGAASQERTWAPAVLTALGEMADLLESRPGLARGLLIEVHVAGGRAMRKRAEVLARLAEALDGAREDPGVRHSPPPLTSSFMLSAIEAFITGTLLRAAPQEFGAGMRELAEMVLSAYFGRNETIAELELLLAA
jgi:AcrR family transcriptional regulator